MYNPNTVSFTKTPAGHLRITLEPEGHTEIIESHQDIHSDDFFLELIEFQLCNGWERILPEQCGALTSAIILSDNHGINLYSNINSYQIESPVQVLLRDGYIIFEAA
jgi:hypothetical protein